MSWLAPSKLRRTVLVGSEKMVVYEDGAPEPVRVFDRGVVYRDPETFGEYHLSYRTGDIVSPHLDGAEPLAVELQDFTDSVRSGDGGHHQLDLALDVVRMIEAAETVAARRRGSGARRGGRRTSAGLVSNPSGPSGAILATPGEATLELGAGPRPHAAHEQIVATARPPRDYFLRRALATADLLAVLFAGAVALPVPPGLRAPEPALAPPDPSRLARALPPLRALRARRQARARLRARRPAGALPRVRPGHPAALGLPEAARRTRPRRRPGDRLRRLRDRPRCHPPGRRPARGAAIRRLRAGCSWWATRRSPTPWCARCDRTPSTASSPSARSRSASGRTHRRTPPPRPPRARSTCASSSPRDGVERVIVTAQDLSDEAMMDLVRDCGAASVKVSVVPDHINALGPSVAIDDIEGLTILGLNPLVLSSSSRLLKRLLDVAGATAGILVAAPVLALSAIAIKLDSPGPVLFRQRRIGRGGTPFTVLKFRTMVVDAEARTRGAAFAEQRSRLAEARPRPARHPRRPPPARDQPRRAAAALERADRRDEPRRARGR